MTNTTRLRWFLRFLAVVLALVTWVYGKVAIQGLGAREFEVPIALMESNGNIRGYARQSARVLIQAKIRELNELDPVKDIQAFQKVDSGSGKVEVVTRVGRVIRFGPHEIPGPGPGEQGKNPSP